MPTARSALRAALTGSLLPALQGLGFTGPSSIAGNSLLHEFRRPSQRGNCLLTVQLEKNGLPRFILSLANEPPGGFEAAVANGGIVRQGRVQPRRGATTGAWFRTDHTLLQRVRRSEEPSAAAVVASCVALLPEVDGWWQTEAPSEHITVLETNFPGQQRAVA